MKNREEKVEELINNIDKIHTTEMGIVRIKKNLNITTDPVKYCIELVKDIESEIELKGKNYYITNKNITITINKYSFTIITAHKNKK